MMKNWMDYYAMLQSWKQIADHITVRDFDKEVKTVGLINSFQSIIGVENLEIQDETANKSPDMQLIHILARFNKQKIKFDSRKVSHAASILKNKHPELKSKKYILGRLERVRLLKNYAASNEELKKEYDIDFSKTLPDDEGELFVEEPSLDYCLSLIAAMSNMK